MTEPEIGNAGITAILHGRYVTPADRLADRHQEIWRERDHKLEAARERRRKARRKALQSRHLTKTMALSEAGR